MPRQVTTVCLALRRQGHSVTCTWDIEGATTRLGGFHLQEQHWENLWHRGVLGRWPFSRSVLFLESSGPQGKCHETEAVLLSSAVASVLLLSLLFLLFLLLACKCNPWRLWGKEKQHMPLWEDVLVVNGDNSEMSCGMFPELKRPVV